MNEETKSRVGPALGKISSGIYITTAWRDARPLGMLSSFVEQAGFEPPMLSLAVGKGRALLDALDPGATFGVNVVSRGGARLLKPFSSPDVADPFAAIAWSEGPAGIPRLDDAMAVLACVVRGSMDAGDHVLLLAEVVDGQLIDPEADPMVRVRSNGFSY